jgi:5-methylcytosine-specific restriction protein A
MPITPPKPCAADGCPNLTRSGRYCTEHQALGKRVDQRASANQRGYGARWRKVREMYLRANPICSDPFGFHASAGEVVLAVDVHHKIAKRNGGKDIRENFEGLCHSCHSRVTSGEGRGDQKATEVGLGDRRVGRGDIPAKLNRGGSDEG